MNHYDFSPLIKSMFQRIGSICEAYKVCSDCCTNPYISQSMRDISYASIPLYREMLWQEIEVVKNILLSEMDQEEDILCHESER